MDYPVYRLALSDDPESGVDAIALVDDPAIQRNFIAFKAEGANKITFQATNTEQRILSGPLMVSDMYIFREDDTHGPHYVYFDSDSIKKSVLRFFQNGNTSKINLMHIPGSDPGGIFMFESFLIDSTRGISTPAGFDALPDGSWFGSFKVDNDAIWNHFIATGEFRGFSVEGFFNYQKPSATPEEQQLQDIIDILNSIE